MHHNMHYAFVHVRTPTFSALRKICLHTIPRKATPKLMRLPNDSNPSLLAVLVLAVVSGTNYCMWSENGVCEQCSYNLFLHNGSCVDTCPDGYQKKRPSWVHYWQHEIGSECSHNGKFTIQAWGDLSYGGSNAPTDSGYVNIFSTYLAFAGLKNDGSIKHGDIQTMVVPMHLLIVDIYISHFTFSMVLATISIRHCTHRHLHKSLCLLLPNHLPIRHRTHCHLHKSFYLFHVSCHLSIRHRTHGHLHKSLYLFLAFSIRNCTQRHLPSFHSPS